MSLDLLKNDPHDPPVDAAFVVARLAEQCPACLEAAYDDERHEVTLDAATFDVEQGLRVSCGGKLFRLNVTAEVVDQYSPELQQAWTRVLNLASEQTRSNFSPGNQLALSQVYQWVQRVRADATREADNPCNCAGCDICGMHCTPECASGRGHVCTA